MAAMSTSARPSSFALRVRRLWLLAVLAWGLATAWLVPRADDPLRLALLVPVALLCLGSPAAPLGRAWLQAGLAGLPVLVAVLMPPVDMLRASLVAMLLLGASLLGLHHRRLFLTQQVLRDRTALLMAELAAEKEAAEEARSVAEAATRARTSFFTAASHDLRQPLHALVLFTKSLQLRNRDPGLDETLGQLAGAIESLDHLFDRLLDLSSLDAGVVKVDARAFHLREVYARLTPHFEPQAFDKGLSLSFRGGRHAALADPVLVERILRNLLSNAIRFTEDGGVLVSCRLRPEGLLLQVWDSGRGIDDVQLPRIFDEYYQVGSGEGEAATEEPVPRRGRGLGLAIVRRLALLMALPLRVSSRPGHGTVFTLQLPLASAAQIEAASRMPPTPPRPLPTLQGIHVVCIGEAAAAEPGVAGLLRGWEATVSAFASPVGLAAWAAVQPQVPALLIADARLPSGADGLAPVRLLRGIFGQPVPAVLLLHQLPPGDPTGSTFAPHEPDVHGLPHPVPPNRLRAMVGAKLGPRPPSPSAGAVGTVQSRSPT
ncbi:MAG: hypothetical protein RL654_226 [Pseudomonadota bacterium]|jgi:signal transduction histidine kinase